MREGGGGPGLALEALQPVGVCGDVLRQDLEGDLAIELGVARAVDLAHPPGTERGEDLVTPETDSG
jgi:hypothetical protein